MAFTAISLAVAFVLRVPALYFALSRSSYYGVDKSSLLILAGISTLMGFIMPASGGIFETVAGTLFRIALLAVIIMVMTRIDILDAFGVVFVAAILEAIMIAALMISPVSFLVAGMTPLSIP